jgi:VanZ family protein
LQLKSFLNRWLPVLVCAGVIFLVSANPNPYQPLPSRWRQPNQPRVLSRDERLGCLLHVAEYAVLGALALRALGRGKPVGMGALLAVVGLCGLYALSDELHQFFVPGRAFQLSDLGLDLIGILAGAALYLRICKVKSVHQTV